MPTIPQLVRTGRQLQPTQGSAPASAASGPSDRKQARSRYGAKKES